jgi:hypothetical protein
MKSHLSKIVYGKVELRYDFAKLTRWLLKVSYNSARSQKASVESFRSLIPYILGKDPSLPDRVLFFVAVVTPSTRILRGNLEVFEPREHRSGKISFKDKPGAIFIREGRMVAIDSFYFFILFLHVPGNEIVYEQVKSAFFPPPHVRLEPAARSIDLQPAGEYFEAKFDQVLTHGDAMVDWYRRYRSKQQKGQKQ